MSEALPNFEGLLREALAPVEPPEDLVERLEGTLTTITALAADELEAWELSAMRDPRNWARPAAVPTRRTPSPERDLSVQLSGWMLMEAAHALLTGRPEATIRLVPDGA